MTNANQPQSKGQPALADLMAKFLKKQTEAHAEGLASVHLIGEVQPYEAGPVQPIDSKPAWEEAVAVVKFVQTGHGNKTLKAPPGWPNLVAVHEPAFDLAMCLGNFPQLVRNLHPLLSAKNLGELRKAAVSRPTEAPVLTDWAKKVARQQQFPELLLAIGALRLAKQYDLAEKLIEENEVAVPAQYRSLWDNEKAALAWHQGNLEEARKLWQAQPDSIPVLFNRGMAALFLNDKLAARDHLTKAVNQLPETSAWHHLARLYLTLAEQK